MSADSNYWLAWGLAEDPFSERIDSRFTALVPGVDSALTLIYFTLKRNRGAVLLSGPLGAGKTAALAQLEEGMARESTQVVRISLVDQTPQTLLKALVRKLGCAVIADDAKLLSQILHLEFMDRFDAGRRTLLIFDDADHVKDRDVVEIINKITNARIGTSYVVSMVLAGGPALTRQIAEHPELLGRLAFQVQLPPVSAEDMIALIQHRLTTAGWSKSTLPFTGEGLEHLFRASHGIPANICHIVRHAMSDPACQRAGLIDAFFIHQSHPGEPAA